jgi:predicted permease
MRDARLAVRSLTKTPVFTAAALLTLALGIGATTAIFSVVNGVLLRPLPYPNADRLVRIYQQNAPDNRCWALSVVDFQAVMEDQRVFEHVAGLTHREVTITGSGTPERVRAAPATADLFRTLGMEPAEGRGFRPGEDEPGTPPVVVISHAFSERRFGTGISPVGAPLTIDQVPHTVIGVMAPGVTRLGGASSADVWPILQLTPPTRRGPFFIRAIGRLRETVSPELAGADLARVSRSIFPQWSEGFRDSQATLTPYPLRDTIVGDVVTPLYLLLGAVVLVLMIATANVASLMVVRASAREREMAVRASLGASRARLVRQLVVESLVLASAGGLAGLLLAFVGLQTLLAGAPNLPRLDAVSVDLKVLGATAVLTLGSGLLFGLAPLVHGWSEDLAARLNAAGRSGMAGRGWHRLRGILVTAEFALAVPLLAGAVLLLSSLSRLQDVDVGFAPDDVFSTNVSLPAAAYPDAASIQAFWRTVLAGIRDLPEVEQAALTSELPPDNLMVSNNFDLLDHPVAPGTSEPTAPWLIVTPGFYETMGIPLLRGRDFTPADSGPAPPVVAVSRAWARRYFPDTEVLGRRLYSGGCRTCQPTTVIAVVGDVPYRGLDDEDAVAVYQPQAQWTWSTVQLVVRAAGSPGSVMDRVRDVIQSQDPDIPVTGVVTMGQRLSDALARPRYWSKLVGVFAAFGVVLAAIGIYGVLAYFVSRQSRDIGLRMALGANASTVRRLVIARGMAYAATGTVIGLVAARLSTGALTAQLYQVRATDPRVFVMVALVLLVVGLAACAIPARRASRVDPARVLGAE